MLALFGPLGVGQLLPVLERPGEVLEAHVRGLVHQHLFVTGHGGLGAVPPGRGNGLGRILADGALAPSPRHCGQVTQGPAQAHPALGGRPWDPAAAGDPRGRRLGPLGRPVLPCLESRRGLGHEGLEACFEVVQLLHRLAVAVVGRVRGDQCLECIGEVLQLHGIDESTGLSHTETARLQPKSTQIHRLSTDTWWIWCDRSSGEGCVLPGNVVSDCYLALASTGLRTSPV